MKELLQYQRVWLKQIRNTYQSGAPHYDLNFDDQLLPWSWTSWGKSHCICFHLLLYHNNIPTPNFKVHYGQNLNDLLLLDCSSAITLFNLINTWKYTNYCIEIQYVTYVTPFSLFNFYIVSSSTCVTEV